ncbi:DUF3040 domain-containing protein [Amycolatopsis cihanbeyliensis]|uniref:DUF3040 family protein n=1 Tax=Amycolatopsis cihanbeyliensis TaxID=1128664 RepID=A0A542DRG6_AMYCI|nr:DUF3040 domain-containing protein [Amycolatopsis cihanbeyliensis]TQJ05606.1 DUF3040 family protein [Amycolatopsis cihanbeyliensis]
MFSQHDRQQLRKIEQWFEESDPELAKALQEGAPPRRYGRMVRTAVYLLAGFLVVFGLVSMIFPLVFLGAIVAGVTACTHLLGLDQPGGS